MQGEQHTESELDMQATQIAGRLSTKRSRSRYPQKSQCRRLSRSERRQWRTSTPTKFRLTQLGIGTFGKDAVKTYMDTQIQKFRNPEPVITSQNYPRPGFVACGMFGCAFMIFLVLFTRSGQVSLADYATTALVSFGILCFGLRGKTIEKKFTPRPNHLAKWETMDYTEYCRRFSSLAYDSLTSAVPLPVQRTAELLGKEFPNAQLNVHYLYKDPFLEFVNEEADGSMTNEFVAFWDEDGFVH